MVLKQQSCQENVQAIQSPSANLFPVFFPKGTQAKQVMRSVEWAPACASQLADLGTISEGLPFAPGLNVFLLPAKCIDQNILSSAALWRLFTVSLTKVSCSCGEGSLGDLLACSKKVFLSLPITNNGSKTSHKGWAPPKSFRKWKLLWIEVLLKSKLLVRASFIWFI